MLQMLMNILRMSKYFVVEWGKKKDLRLKQFLCLFRIPPPVKIKMELHEDAVENKTKLHL